MTAYAIARTAKLHTASQVRAVVGHNARTRPTPNADATRKNHVFRDAGPDPYGAVMRRIAAEGIKPRAGAVLALEVFLSASPEYFRPGRPEAAGEWDNKRMKDWAKAALAWMEQEYGDRLIDARLHLDESTPHIQAVIVPLTEDGRLSAKEVNGKIALKRMQATYAKALEPLGIQRGIEGSKAKHTSVRAFYAAANAPLPPAPEPVRAPAVETPPMMLKEQARADWAKGQTKAIADSVAQGNKRFRREIVPALNKAKVADLAQRKMAEMQQTIQALAQERDEAKEAAQKAQQKAEAAVLRDIPLDRVMAVYGLEIDPAAPRLKPKYAGEGHLIRVEGRKWFDDGENTRSHGTGSIDLVKHLVGCDYGQAVAWLRDRIGTEPVAEAHALAQKEQAVAAVEQAQPPQFKLPEPNPGNWPKVRKFLTEVRNLPAYLVDRLHGAKKVFADARANGVFVMVDANDKAVGAELKGSDPSRPFAGMAPGSSRRQGQFSTTVGGSPNRIVVTESAIDAISYAGIHPVKAGEPGYLVVSTGGVRSTIEWLGKVQKRGIQLVVAYDNDKAGNEKANNLMAEYTRLGGIARREVPEWGKDWNDMLTSPSPEPEAAAPRWTPRM